LFPKNGQEPSRTPIVFNQPTVTVGKSDRNNVDYEQTVFLRCLNIKI